jgi:hypothetical protein
MVFQIMYFNDTEKRFKFPGAMGATTVNTIADALKTVTGHSRCLRGVVYGIFSIDASMPDIIVFDGEWHRNFTPEYRNIWDKAGCV